MIEPITYFGAAIGFAAMAFCRSRSCASWARWVYLTVAGLFVFMALCGFALDFDYWDLSKHGRSVLESYMQVIRGFILGCVFVLIVSGNFARKKVLKYDNVPTKSPEPI